jgi:hypothetical protein
VSVYFQKITEDKFSPDSSFQVKESKKMRLFIGIIALGIAVVMVQGSVFMAVVAATFGVVSLIYSRRNQTIMEINKDGFFYYGRLVTNWNNFVSARFIDQAPQLSSNSLGISDQFFIAIRYRKVDSSNCFEQKIALTNTQDKSEEEILAAIRFYYKNSAANRQGQ